VANREIYGGGPGLFPLRGDLSAEAGAVTVEVIGLQTIPIAPNPLIDKTVPTYVAANNDIEWLASQTANIDIFVNGNPVSEDALILVANNFILAGDHLAVVVNGVRVA